MFKHIKIHLLVLALVIIAELIGVFSFDIGPGKVVLLPMLYALVLGVCLKFVKLVSLADMKKASPLIGITVMLLMARYGTLIGPKLGELIQAGPAFLLQEFGNLGTLVLALPLAIFLGMKREAVGATHSVAREPNLALISDVYGLDSPEGKGVMGVYICGTLFGTIFFGIMAGVVASLTPLHPLALAMASGIGSASMTTAAAGSLVAMFPDMEAQILAYAATSNLLTGATGLYASIFIGLPLANLIYGILTKGKKS